MLNSQLLQTCKILTPRDWRELRKVVRSPYFNSRDEVTRLFDLIEKEFAQTVPNFNKETAYKKVFPKTEFDDLTMRQTMSYLLQVVKKYLITEGVLGHESESALQLTVALRARNADKLLENNLEKTAETIDNQLVKNKEQHYLKYRLLVEQYNYQSERGRGGNFSLQAISDELDQFYTAETLRQACIMHAHATVSKQTYVQPLLPAVLEKLSAERTTQTTPNPASYIVHQTSDINLLPSVNLYFQTYLTLKEPNETAHFEQLKTQLLDNQHLFPENEKRDLFLFATNYCVQRLNRGDQKYAKEALDLYRVGLENRAVFERGVLLPSVYKNIHTLALKAEEYDWAAQFLETYKPFLPERERENVYRYNSALHHFRRNNYEKAMILLQQTQLNDVLNNLDARRLLARIYFELAETTALESHIESSKIYLHRQKNLGYQRESYLNFFKFLEQLIKLKTANSKLTTQNSKLKILRGSIEATELLAERTWLLEKLG